MTRIATLFVFLSIAALNQARQAADALGACQSVHDSTSQYICLASYLIIFDWDNPISFHFRVASWVQERTMNCPLRRADDVCPLARPEKLHLEMIGNSDAVEAECAPSVTNSFSLGQAASVWLLRLPEVHHRHRASAAWPPCPRNGLPRRR